MVKHLSQQFNVWSSYKYKFFKRERLCPLDITLSEDLQVIFGIFDHVDKIYQLEDVEFFGSSVTQMALDNSVL